MALLMLGLFVFLGVHSLRIISESRRTSLLELLGEKKFKGIYAVLSLLGFLVLVAGYAQARLTPQWIWMPPAAARHAMFLLMWLAFILWASTYINGNVIKQRIGHPMVVGVKVWALAHLVANGQAHQMVLFSAFLLWAVLSFRSARKRDRLALLRLEEQGLPPEPKAPVSKAANGLVLAIGTIVWMVFMAWGHKWLIGVSPFAINLGT
jgi:uncharacterized membrane protein